MTLISYFGKQNSTLGSVVPLAVFIFQVFCADKDNIEDVRSGSEAEVDSESDAPRKER